MELHPELILDIWYSHNAVNNPIDFIFLFLKLWDSANLEPLKLYYKTTAYPKITREILKEKVSFTGKNKLSFHRHLRLKSSLASQRDVVDFDFENLSEDWKRLHPNGWGRMQSQIIISIPLAKINRKAGYELDSLTHLFCNLLADRSVDQAFVDLSTDVYFDDDGVYSKICSLFKGRNISPLRWITYYTLPEIGEIYELFGNKDLFLSFCREQKLELIEQSNINGCLIKIPFPPVDMQTYYSKLLEINQAFLESIKITRITG